MLLLLTASICLGAVGAYLVSKYALVWGLIDYPLERSSHRIPTPRGGGIGIVGAFMVSALFLKLPISFWVPSVILSYCNYLDDKLGLTPKTRLLLQFTIATSIIILNFQIISFPKFMGNPLLFLPFFLIFIVGTSNFFNFMDGINGIAGIIGIVAFGLLSAFANLYAERPDLALVSASISAACLGFLPFNLPRARVFMGDLGSIFLGFTYGVLAIILVRNVSDLLTIVSFLFVFYADAITTIYIRWQRRECIFNPHRCHLYQLLANEMGFPHSKVALIYGTIQLILGLLMLAIYKTHPLIQVSLLVLIGIIYCILSFFVRRFVSLRNFTP